MEGSESGEQFLHRKDSKLHTTGAVEREQNRKRRIGKPVSQKPAEKIASWLEVLERTHIGHRDDPRVIERIKDYYHREYVIKPENIPQSYWNLQGEIAINEGRKQDLIDAGVEIEELTTHDSDGNEVKKRSFIFPDEIKETAIRTVISNQQQSLDNWVDYLTSDDAPYPMWARYWVFHSVVKMGKLEKTPDGKARFANRRKNTVASFPILNQRALADTISAISARLETRLTPKGQQTKNLSTTLSDEEYQKLLSTEDFSKLYAQFLSKIPEYSTYGLEETRGRWVKYPQGSDPTPLVKSLERYPLEWCTADIDTARTQLKGGDFYVYYSIDGNGNPVIPRLAIRMEGSRIAEPPRGIAHDQNLDPYISDVLAKKLEEFGSGGKAFKKRTADMKRLTEIEKKVQIKSALNIEDLKFLYEIDSTIDGFGYHRDSRIKEIKLTRNLKEDMPIVFGCTPNQIAHRASEINPGTKVYVGPLEKGIFNRLQQAGIEHVYNSFPEGRVRMQKLEIGGKSKQQLVAEMKQRGINIYEDAQQMIDSTDFTTLPQKDSIDLVRLRVQDLGLKGTPTTDEVYAKANELGLDLCPAEVGPHLRLKNTDQPLGEWYLIGMKQIAVRHGHSHVFYLVRHEYGLWLSHYWAEPGNEWYPDDEFVFALRKENETQSPQKLGLFDRLFKS